MALPATYVEGFHDEAKCRAMKYTPLGRTGMHVSLLSLGCSSIGAAFHATSDEESYKVVHESLKNGINYLDTAAWYGFGKSESVLGRALATVPRKAYFISTKCCRYKPDVLETFDWTAERTIRSVDESLARLGLAYVDVMQVHDPEFCPSLDTVCNIVLPALQRCKDAGKIRFIGVTGYPLAAQRYIIENTTVHIDTAMTYCHYTLNDSSLISSGFLDFCAERGIGVMNAAAVSMGLLTARGPPAWHPALAHHREACKAAAEWATENGFDISKLALHFTLHTQPAIATTLCSTSSVARALSNIAAATSAVTEEEAAATAHIIRTFFDPLKGRETWEGVEPAAYFAKLATAQAAAQAAAEAAEAAE